MRIIAFLSNTVRMKNYIIFLIVFSIVFVSRLPFLNAGYGNEQDGWRVASAARYIGTTGEYKASRLPGFPVVEFAYSLVWKHGAWAMNMLTAFASAIAVGVLSLIAKHYKCKDFILLALAFAFTPIVFINSTVTMDYMWAMMFIMLGWYAGLNEKPIIAGFLLGIATGCRITSILLVLPFALIFWERQNWKLQLPMIIKFWVAAGIASVLTFVPAFLTYGTHFITGYRRDSLPSVTTIACFITNDVWGLLGSLAVLAVPFMIFRNHKKSIESSILQIISIDRIILWFAVLALFVVEFALHPMKGAYIIPAIPFLLLLCALYLTRIQFFSHVSSSFSHHSLIILHQLRFRGSAMESETISMFNYT